MRYAKAPEDVLNMSTDEPSTPGRDDLSSDLSASDFEDDLEEQDDSEEERERRLKALQEQVRINQHARNWSQSPSVEFWCEGLRFAWPDLVSSRAVESYPSTKLTNTFISR